MNERIEKQLSFIIELDKMKSVFRHTILIDKSRLENDAEHSFHIAMMAIVLKEHSVFPDINLERVLKMLLCHDLIEIYAGDTFAYDDVENGSKERRENDAAAKLFSILPAGQGAPLEALWREFDAMETHDALFAAALDRLQPMLNNLETDGHTWREGTVTREKVWRRAAPIAAAIPDVWAQVKPQIETCLDGILGVEK